MIPVILDMNLSDNVDEVLALALAAASPEIQLVGVTLPCGRDDVLTLATRQILGAFEREDVVVAARSRPAFRRRSTAFREGIGKIAQRYFGPVAHLASEDSVDFIAKQASRLDRVTIVATAPLTNIAELLRRYPHVRRSIEQIVVMGGWPTQALPEWNVMIDPDAVSAVLGSGMPVKLVGYEVTLGCTLSDDVIARFAAARGRGPGLVAQYFSLWSQVGLTPVVLHDPLTVALAFEPSLGRFVKERVSVILDEGPGRGSLYLDPVGGHVVDLCVDVNAGRLLDVVVSRLWQDSSVPAMSAGPTAWTIKFEAAYRNTYYSGWRVAPQSSYHHTLILTLKGTCRVCLQDEEFSVEPESVIYIPRNETYSISTQDDLELIWIQFDVIDDGGGPVDRISDLPRVIHAQERFSLLLERADEILSNWQRSWIDVVLRCRASLLNFLGDLLDCVYESRGAAPSETYFALAKAKRYIETHLTHKVDLETLSRHVGISKYYLVRLFRETYGVSPLKYHVALRMKRAQTLLKLPHVPISDVAKEAGYSSINTFSRAFRQEVGLSPRQYRERVLNRSLRGVPGAVP